MAMWIKGPERFGAAIRKLRESKGWSQEALSANSGVSQVAISQIERGERLAKLDSMLALVEALGRALVIDFPQS